MARSSNNFIKAVFWFLCLLVLPIAYTSPVIADPGPSPLDGGSEDETSVGGGQVTPMTFQPLGNAEELADFLPPDGLFTTASLQPTTLSTALTLPPHNSQLIRFGQGDVSLLVEEETFTTAVTLTYQQSETSPPAVGESWPERLLFFQLEVKDAQTHEPIAYFDKNVRLVIDLRSFGLDVTNLGDGNYFLAYRDPEQPSVWHDVPVWTHQADGLISAEVNHFSDWTAGWRPEVWKPEWNPPAVSEFSGAATYSYPFNVPPGRRGLQPTVSLSYNSRGLDGAIHGVGGDTLASGWSMADIYVAREGVKIDSEQNNFRLIHPDRFRLVLNGQGHELTAEGTTTEDVVRYYAKDAPGLRVYRYYDADVNTVPNTEGIYWIVQTADGTQYRLGYIAGAEEWHQIVAQGSIEISGHRGRDATGEQQQTSAMGWHVDTVTDIYGNQIVYNYNNEVGTKYRCERGDFCGFELEHRHHKVRIASIAYNFPGRVALNSNGSIPNHVDRLSDPPHLQTPATLIAFHARGYEDNNGHWNENLMGPIQNILIYHGDNVNVANPIREYRLESENRTIDPNVADCPGRDDAYPQSSVTRVLLQIQEWANTDRNPHDSTDGYGLPPLQFTYTGLPHYYQGNDSNRPCFSFSYLESASNGYGGVVYFTYESDGRSIGNYIRQGFHAIWWPDHGFNYVVTAVTYQDGRVVDGNALSWKTEYAYYRPCYAQWSDNVGDYHTPTKCHTPGVEEYGNIAGFLRTTVTYKGYENETLNVRQTEFALINDGQEQLPEMGRPLIQDSLGADGVTVLRRTTSTYATTPIHNNIGSFTYTQETRSYQYHNGISSATLSRKIRYDYNPDYQKLPDGSAGQFGQITYIAEYDDAAAEVPLRTTRRWYRINNADGYWTINQTSEGIYAGNSWDPLAITWMYYDEQNSTPGNPGITRGEVTRVRQFLIDPEFDCSQVSGGNGSGGGYLCDKAFRTIDQTMTYDEYGNINSRTSYGEYGYQTQDTVGPNVNYNLRDVPAADPHLTTIDYDTTFNLYPISTTTALGTTLFSIYGFNAPLIGFQRQTGLLKEVTGPDGITTKYEYDPFGRLHAVYDGDVSTGTPFAGFGNSEKGDGDPLVRHRYWDNAWNSGTQFLDPAGGAPFIISVEKRPGSFPAPAGSGSGYAFNDQTFYDGFGRPIQTRSLWHWVEGQAKSREILTHTDYGANGQVSCQSVPYDVPFYSDQPKTWPASPFYTEGNCANKPRTTTTYDALGRPLVVTAPDGTTSVKTYAVTDHVTVNGTSHLLRTQHFDANNHHTNTFMNVRGELVMVREFSGNSQATYAAYADTRYTYDAMGNLTHIGTSNWNNSQPSTFLRQTTMSYDSYGRKVSMDDPDMGVWHYSYDALGNLLQQEDANGNTLCMHYDELNRLETKRHSSDSVCNDGDTLLAAYSYYDAGVGAKGQLHEIRWPDANNREAFTYDTLGRLIQHERWIDGQLYTMQVSKFDAFHRPTQTIYPNGEVVTVTYDHEGENSLTGSLAGSLVDNVTYNAMGQMRLFDRSGGLDTIFSYYEAGSPSGTGNGNFRLQTIQHGAINDDLPSFTYTYDPVGNVKSIGERIQDNTAMQTFGYDHLNRLEAAYAPESSPENPVPGYNHAYAYDPLGNLISNAGRNYQYNEVAWHNACPEPPPQSLPHAVRMVDNDYFCYDANGNMIIRNDETGSYLQAFDVENRLTTITNTLTPEATQFTYDAAGIRVKTVRHDGTTIYTPFPNYEEEQRLPAWEALDPLPAVSLTTPDDDSRSLATSDAPGWGLGLSQQAQWATSLLPVPVDDLATTADNTFPATSLYTGEGVGAPHTAGGQPIAINNLAQGASQSPGLDLIPGRAYNLRVWVKSAYTGAAAIHLLAYGDTSSPTQLWSAAGAQSEGGTQIWQEVNVTFVMPASLAIDPLPASHLQLTVEQLNGWVAFDNLRLYELNQGKAAYGFEESSGTETLIYNTGFEPGHDWDSQPDHDFPATAIWVGGSGPAAPQQGIYSLTLSNLGHGASLTSPVVNLPVGSNQLTVQMQVQKDLADTLNGNADGVTLDVLYYDDMGMQLTASQIWHSDELASSPAWQSISLTDSVPPNAVSFTLFLSGSFYDGWIAFNNISAAGVTWNFEAPTWTAQSSSAFPAGTVWHGSFNGLSFTGHLPDLGHVYAFTNRARAAAVPSTWFDALPYQSYRIDGWVRGQLTGNVGSGSVWLEYYNGAQFVQRILVWQKTSHNSSIWQPVSETVTIPIYADRFRLVVAAERLDGWLAVDDVTVLDQTQPSPWQITNTWEQVANGWLPATGMAGANAPHSGDGTALTLHNLATGALTSTPVSLVAGQTYRVEAWVKPYLLDGTVYLEVLPFGDPAQAIKLWEPKATTNNGWQPISGVFVMPSGSAQPSYLRWGVAGLSGFVAVDDIVIRSGFTDDQSSIVFTEDFETESDWVPAGHPDFPATSIWRGDAGPATPHGGLFSVAFSNLPDVSLISPRVEIREGRSLKVEFQYMTDWQTGGSAGGFALEARYYGGEKGSELLGAYPLWSDEEGTLPGWETVSVTHTPPAGATEVELWFRDRYTQGWAALNQVTLLDALSGNQLIAWDFNTDSLSPYAAGWSVATDTDFPAGTAYWPGDLVAAAAEGEGVFLFTNEAGGMMQTGRIPAEEGRAFNLRAFVNYNAGLSHPARLLVQFYQGEQVTEEALLWVADNQYRSRPWAEVNDTFTTPPGTDAFRIVLEGTRLGGRLRLDGVRLAAMSDTIPAQPAQDYELAALVAGNAPAAGQESAALIVAYYNSSGAQIGTDTVWGGVDYGQVPAAPQSGVFTTPPETAHLRVGLAASVDNDVAEGWLLYDRVALTAVSQPVSIAPGQSLDLSAAVRGELAGPAGQVSGQLAAHFYDSQGNLLAVSPIWQAAAYNQPTTPLTHSGRVSHPTATQMRVGLRTVLDEGWLAFDSIKLTSLSAPITVRPGQDHTLAVQINGQLEGTNAARLFIRYSDGTIVTIWQNESGFTGSQPVSGDFTTPAGVGSFQVGTEVSLDQGHLSLTNVTLTAYSAAFPVTAGGAYQFTGQVTGALAASLGQGGRITAVYTDSEGHGETLLWQNPANFNGTTTVQRTFTGNASGAPTRLALTANLAAGHLAFGDVDLQYLAAGDIIQRSTYMLAGQAVAVRVSGDPEGHDGLYYLYSDHLGSASAMQKDDGSTPIVTRYLPFGGYREGSGPNEVTDRGFTGHKHNDNLGLVYMNARFYVSYIYRMVSPDTIIPDPTNPQSFNRYSYALNNPVKYRDQSGHCVDGITTWACIAAGVAAVTKVVDWGWTAYDAWQSGRTLANPNASRGERMMAALNIGVSALFEVIEPDDILPVGLPIDDIARRGVLRGAYEALEAGGDEALEAFVRDKFGDYADDVLGKMWGALCSFSGDTMVVTEDGLVAISEVDLLDKVLAYNEETGEIGYYPVVAVWEHLDSIIVTLTIDGEEIETTPEHPFYTAAGNWLPAAHLQIGDEIRTAAWETGTVEAIRFAVAPQPMYNFTVATAHTYFVGDGQWLVHNDCISFDFRQVQSKFDNHAPDFGITGNWSNANGRRFQDALTAHVYGANTTKITGTYRGTIDVIHHYDPTTGLNVITDLDGNFISGWKLSNDQIMNLLNHGNLQ